MGFFSSLWDVVVTVVEVITSPFKTVEVIAEVFYKHNKEDSITAKKIGETDSLTDNSSPAQIKEIANLLRERVEVYQNIGKNLEDTAKSDINDFFEKLTDDFKKNAEVSEQINFKQIKENHKKLLKDIEGAYSSIYKKSLSIDNTDCRKILTMYKSFLKEQSALKFVRNLTEKTFDDFKEKFDSIINRQEKDISDALIKFYNMKIAEFDELTKTFQDWERDMTNQTFNQEKAQLPATVKLYTIDRLEKILAA